MISRFPSTRAIGLLATAIFILLPSSGSAVKVPGADTEIQRGIRENPPLKFALINARLIVSPDVSYDSGVLLIDSGHVVAVGSKIPVPSDAKVIDLKGKWVFPGFIDPFTEYGLKESRRRPEPRPRSPKYTADQVGGAAGNDAIHAREIWSEQFRPDSADAMAFIRDGFTTVQSARLDGIFRGVGFVTLLGDGAPNMLVLKSESLPFASFDKGTSQQQYPSSLMGSIALIRQTFLDADWYKAAIAAWEINPKQPQPEFNADLAAINEYTDRPFMFETDDKLSLVRADRIADEFGSRFILVGSGDEYERIDLVKKTGAKLVIPVDFPDAPDVSTADAALDVSLAELRQWERASYNPSVLEDRGVDFAFTRARLPRSADFLSNVRKAIQHGLSAKRALEALTTMPARLCDVDDLVGTLDMGKLANFIVADTNILEANGTIYSVWVAGNEIELEPIPEVDLAGTYMGTAHNKTMTLSLRSGKRAGGKVTVGEQSDKLASVKLDGRTVTFVMPLAPFGTEGMARMSGRFVTDDSLVGTLVSPAGDQSSWVAIRTADTSAAGESESDDDNAAADTLVSRLTYPNRAFGLETMPERQTVFIDNATVWTSDSAGIIENCDILVEKGRFTEVGRDLTPPQKALVIDGTGKHVTAGIIDPHSHIAISGDVNEGTDALTPQVRIGDVVDSDDRAIYFQLAGGTTTALIIHGSANPIGGQAQVIRLKWGAPPEELKFKESPPSMKFALGENVKQSNWGDHMTTRYPQTRMGVETVMRDEFRAAREYRDGRTTFDQLGKYVKQRTIPVRRDLRLEAINRVLDREMLVQCHAYVHNEMLMLMRLAEDFDFRIRAFIHVLEGYKVAPEMAAHGAMATAFSDWWAYKFEVYDAMPYNTALMHKHGVLCTVNSDNAELARRLPREAAKSIQYGGLSQEDAIRLCTINGAIQLGIDSLVGSIAVGKQADFVIWNDSPLSGYSRVEQTWIEGTKYFDYTLDQLEQIKVEAERQALIQKVLVLGETLESSDERHASRRAREPQSWNEDEISDIWRTDLEGANND